MYNLINKKVYYSSDLVFHERYFPFHHLQFSTTLLPNAIFLPSTDSNYKPTSPISNTIPSAPTSPNFSPLLPLMIFHQISLSLLMTLPHIVHFSITVLQFKPQLEIYNNLPASSLFIGLYVFLQFSISTYHLSLV